jgi:hypothetical protein
MTPTTKAGRALVAEQHAAMHEDGCECRAKFIVEPVLDIEREAAAIADDRCGSHGGSPHRGKRFPWHVTGCMSVHEQGTPCGPFGAGWSSDD